MEYFTNRDFERMSDFGFDMLTVRGPLSQQILENYGISSQIVGDTALILEPPEYHLERSDKVVVSLRRLGEDKWGDDDTVKEIIRALNAEEGDIDIVFLPLNHKDFPINLKACKSIPGSRLVSTHHLQVAEVLSELAEADIVIGERLHAQVLAACCYTPFLALQYRPKNLDFTKSVDMEEYTLSNQTLTEQRLSEGIDRIRREHQQIQSRLKQEVANKRQRLEDAAITISDELQEIDNLVE